MGYYRQISSYLRTLCLVLIISILLSLGISRGVTVFSENSPPDISHIFVIDPGHGGVDGGATSVLGVLESQINLSISQKLNDIMHLLGMHTVMIRAKDVSVYTEGETIAQKKVSDLKHRVRIANNTPNAIFISIHQNYFGDSRYQGAQTFYGADPQSKEFADLLQQAFRINTNTNRSAKAANGVYVMQHVTCPAVLIECGFISNYQEAALLQENSYQIKLASIIATVCNTYLNQSI